MVGCIFFCLRPSRFVSAVAYLYQTKGKAECAAKKIPEETLEALTCEVLITDTLDPNEVRSKITEIRAERNNVIVFELFDGSKIIKQWKDCSEQKVGHRK